MNRMTAAEFRAFMETGEPQGQPKPRKPRQEKEHIEAVKFAKYLDDLVQQKLIAAYSKIPHETYTVSEKVKARNKAEGVRPGVPDYFIVTWEGLLIVELKEPGGGDGGSAAQKVWLARTQGKVCRSTLSKGADQAIAFVNKHLDQNGAKWRKP